MDTKKRYHQEYLIERKLDAGGFGTVFLVKNRREQLFAMKECPSSYEMDILRQIPKIDGIVPILDSFAQNKMYYYVMPYFAGGTLREFREKKRGSLSQEECVQCMLPVAEALASLHKNGVIHRDINPDNLIFDEKGELWLIDFGAAKRIEEHKIPHSVQIRHGYTPPEQYSLDKPQGTWTDVYAFCATIYFMITGAKPVLAKERLRGNHLLTLRELGMSSTEFSDIIENGMRLSVEQRTKTMQELITAFKKILYS